MGLDVYLLDGETELSALPSEKYPDHLFKKTYLQSSYHESGYNRVVKNLVGKDLYDIFAVTGEQCEIHYTKEELAQCLERARDVLVALQNAKPWQVITVAHYAFVELPEITEQDAVKIAIEELEKTTNLPFDWWYSSKDRLFFLKDPPRIIAAIPSKSRFGEPQVHLILEGDLTWYIQATEIVIEFIEYAMALSDPVIYWSS